jgi:mycothiol system anti-sigma-R factor
MSDCGANSDCKETLREMYLYLDDEISPGLRSSVEGHLNGCADCQDAFEFHEELRQMIARKCREDLPPGLTERIMRCFGDETPPTIS